MGNKPSSRQEAENTFNTSVLTKNITNQLSSTSQKVSATSVGIQDMEVVIGELDNCDFTGGQKISSKVVSTGSISEDTTNDLKTSTSTDLTNSATAKLEQSSGFLSMPADQQQTVKQTVNNSIQSITERTFSKEKLQEISSSAVLVQDMKVTILRCRNGKINLSQDLVSEVVAEAIVDDIMKNIMEDENLNKIANSLATEAKQENKGIFESLASMNGAFLGSSIALTICCVIILVVIMKVALSPAGQKALEQGAGGPKGAAMKGFKGG